MGAKGAVHSDEPRPGFCSFTATGRPRRQAVPQRSARSPGPLRSAAALERGQALRLFSRKAPAPPATIASPRAHIASDGVSAVRFLLHGA